MKMKGFEPLYPPHCSARVEILSSQATLADFRGEARLEESNQPNKNYIYIFKNLGKKEGKKTASTPANGVATSGIKEAHLDDFLVVCVEREGRRRRRRRRRGDTVVKRACQLQSLSHSGFYHLKRWNENRRDYAKNWTSPLTLSAALALCFWTPKPYAGARLFSFPRSLGRTV